jgi:putative transposase
VPNAEYFVTFCTEYRQKGLITPAVAEPILDELRAMQAEQLVSVRCATVMPDHVHALVRTGDSLSLGRVVARWKAQTVTALHAAGLKCQRGFHEHRLRPDEARLPFFLYTFLNPYRAGLLEAKETWPWFVCSDDDREWFLPYLSAGLPEPAWLADLP